MLNPSDSPESEVQNTLPPVITNNTREKLLPEQVSIGCIKSPKKNHDERNKVKLTHSFTQSPKKQLQSNCPINVVYHPKALKYELGDITTVHSLRVWNASVRSLYVKCNGILNKSEDHGAIFFWYPRTRSLLAPGLETTFKIKTIPKDVSPVSSSRLALQIAAAYKSDSESVVRHFSVPIEITFLKYTPPCLPEDADSTSFHQSL
ncbi:uncharacterized protein LOC124543988 [Vanessa cardui]|uniref:uncharacterized protein LOC124543988 n=1 Tax=Vanessa cardui TaxID=171605 RepID=UPI001F12D42B|nr:uncharacterized protein LOC124543988 [Vanessa cardui]